MRKIHSKAFGELIIGEKLGSGYFRNCYAFENSESICMKTFKPKLGISRRLQVFLFRKNMNLEEYKSYISLPEELKPYFNPVLEAERNYLLMKKPTNHDGSYSRSVRSYQAVIKNEKFWKEVEQLFFLLNKHEQWFFDAFNGNNMFIQERSESEWVPIIVDYKQEGWIAYPGQINLLLKSERKKKLKRLYGRFTQKYQFG